MVAPALDATLLAYDTPRVDDKAKLPNALRATPTWGNASKCSTEWVTSSTSKTHRALALASFIGCVLAASDEVRRPVARCFRRRK